MIRRFLGRAAVREVGVGGTDLGSARPGLTAPAGVDACTCEQIFFPDVVDVACPRHGLAPAPLFVRTGLCAAGRHEFCQNRVYQGHNGVRSVYVPCDCDCHGVSLKAAA